MLALDSSRGIRVLGNHNQASRRLWVARAIPTSNVRVFVKQYCPQYTVTVSRIHKRSRVEPQLPPRLLSQHCKPSRQRV